MSASGCIQNLGRQWPESLVHDLEQPNYHFSILEVSYSYLYPFSIYDLIKVAISYEF